LKKLIILTHSLKYT